MSKYKNLNEEINRMKSLFTEERLYGNFIENEDNSNINEELIFDYVDKELLMEQQWLKTLWNNLVKIFKGVNKIPKRIKHSFRNKETYSSWRKSIEIIRKNRPGLQKYINKEGMITDLGSKLDIDEQANLFILIDALADSKTKVFNPFDPKYNIDFDNLPKDEQLYLDIFAPYQQLILDNSVLIEKKYGEKVFNDIADRFYEIIKKWDIKNPHKNIKIDNSPFWKGIFRKSKKQLEKIMAEAAIIIDDEIYTSKYNPTTAKGLKVYKDAKRLFKKMYEKIIQSESSFADVVKPFPWGVVSAMERWVRALSKVSKTLVLNKEKGGFEVVNFAWETTRLGFIVPASAMVSATSYYPILKQLTTGEKFEGSPLVSIGDFGLIYPYSGFQSIFEDLFSIKYFEKFAKSIAEDFCKAQSNDIMELIKGSIDTQLNDIKDITDEDKDKINNYFNEQKGGFTCEELVNNVKEGSKEIIKQYHKELINSLKTINVENCDKLNAALTKMTLIEDDTFQNFNENDKFMATIKYMYPTLENNMLENLKNYQIELKEKIKKSFITIFKTLFFGEKIHKVGGFLNITDLDKEFTNKLNEFIDTKFENTISNVELKLEDILINEEYTLDNYDKLFREAYENCKNVKRGDLTITYEEEDISDDQYGGDEP